MRAACCRFPPRKLACGNFNLQLTPCYSRFTVRQASPSQQAGWGKSGSKLHALQSFAPSILALPDIREETPEIVEGLCGDGGGRGYLYNNMF